MDSKDSTRFYHPELDSLRFLAFLLVFFNHSPYLGSSLFLVKLHDFGWLGVDLFLGLSAYLITKLLFTEFQRLGTIDIVYFYVRRVLRIWPLYFFFVALVVTLTLMERELTAAVARRIAGLASFTDNIFSAFVGYNMMIYSPHLWTISFEEQFYAVIPWTVARLARATDRVRAFALTAFFVMGTVLRGLFIDQGIPHPAVWVLPLTHFEAILGGVALGLGMLDTVLGKINKWVLSLVILGSSMWILFLPNNDFVTWNLMLTYPLIGIATTLTLYFGLKSTSPLSHKLLRNKWTTYLGKISYGLYIYHFGCLKIATEVFNRLSGLPSPIYLLGIASLGLILTIAVSALSYRFLEKPFLRMKERFAIVTSRPV